MREILKIMLIAGITFLVTGCSSKVRTAIPQQQRYAHEDALVYTTKIDNSNGRSLFRSSDAEASAVLALERTAEDTIAAGHNYFAIWAPFRISNYKGSTINTLKQFEDQCFAGVVSTTVSMFDAFGIGDNACGIASSFNQNEAFLDYMMLDEPSDEILVWDAKQLLADLKEQGKLNDRGWKVMPTETNRQTGEMGSRQWFSGAFARWYGSQRARE